MRFAEDAYSKNLLEEALEPVDVVELQKPVDPHDTQYSDVFCEPRPNRPPKEHVPHLGELWEMTAITCSIEHESKTPTVLDLRGLARKQLSLHHLLSKQAADPTLPVPPQWIISPGRPVSGLAAVSATPMLERPTGFYRSVELLEQRIVVLSELPKTAETRLLRLMGPQAMRQEACSEVAALPDDDPAKQPLVEILREMVYFIAKQAESATEVTGTETSQMTPLRQEFEQFQATLRREGKAEGKAEGEAKGKAEALLAVLAARGVAINEIVRQKILASRDLAMLERLLVQAATAASPADVLASAA